MRRISLSDLHPGSVLAKPVYGASGALRLNQGKQITRQFLDSLSSWGIHSVYVDDGAPLPVVPEAMKATYYEAVGRIKVAMEILRRGSLVDAAALGSQLGEFVLQLAAEPCALSCLHLLRERDDYTFHHCIDVGIVAALAGKWLGFSGTDLLQLAMAGALHDLGKARLPLEILNKPGRLTPEEFDVVKTHPLLGHELLTAEFGPGSVVARVALEHHERTDGSGYPQGLRPADTLLASRIVAMADVYDAMTSRRIYRDRSPEFAVLAQLQEDSFGLLDPRVVGAFLEHVIHYAHGRRVRLSNGQIGRVVFIHEMAPTRPIVEVGVDLVDLMVRKDLSVVDEVDEE
ncbi:MAG: HD-GYP domain-containing protein [Bacillota bacterium]|nr:HD-GYP domain-containing protein [Bacillota bacterium]